MTINSLDELKEYIATRLAEDQDYNTAVDTLADITLAVFNYAASDLGMTGFQASCAELEFLRRSRNMKGPFAIVKAEDMLYPQYDIKAKVESYLEEWKPWAAEEAGKLLAENNSLVHPDVEQRWIDLAEEKE